MSTEFQKKVHKALHLIPKGKVTTYAEIAKFLQTKAFRAVGTAIGKNPNAPKCPCHRVVPSSGKIGKYSGKGGIATKIKLLTKEGVFVQDGKIKNFEEVLFRFSEQ